MTRIYDPEIQRWVLITEKGYVEKELNIWPEVKFEYRLDIRFVYKRLQFNVYYERETVVNLEFKGGKRRSNVIWFGVERFFDEIRIPTFFK